MTEISAVIPPEGITVKAPLPTDPGSTHTAFMSTQLFRYDACLDSAVELTLLASSKASVGKGINVISAGCSIGAEADSTLALLEEAGQSDVTMLGVDANNLAVRLARRGRYLVDASSSGKRHESERAIATLGRYGLDIGLDEISGRNGRRVTEIDSSELRSRHNVEFVHADLLEGLPQTEPADLILANNLMFYFEDEEDEDLVARNLASRLTETGILCFGMTSGGLFAHEGVDTPITRMLRREFGLLPIERGSHGHPRIFASHEAAMKFGSSDRTGESLEGFEKQTW